MKHYPSIGGHGTGWPDWWPDVEVRAAVGDSPTSKARPLAAAAVSRILVSFVYDAERIFPRLMAEQGIAADQLDMMLDSGAFTVWTKGIEIDLAEYIEWAKAYTAEVPRSRVVNLDVLPGRPGREPSGEQRESAAKASMENADAIRAAGLPVLEVYHWHESWDVLREIVARRRPGEVIGIGGLAGSGGGPAKREFLDSVFYLIKELSNGWGSLVPLHGFGIAPKSPLARRYPWYSIDASSWLAPARWGRAVGRHGAILHDDSRTQNVEVSALYLERVLRGWKKLELSYSRLWHERGVRFAPDMTGGADGRAA